DQQDRVRLIDAPDAGIEDIAAARAGLELATILAAIDVGRAQRRHQVLQRDHRFGIALVTDDGGDLLAVHALELGGDGAERLVPGGFAQLAGLADIRPVEALVAQAVDRVARLVGDPLLVYVVVQARQDAHHDVAAHVDTDVGAEAIEHIDRFGLAHLPRPRL